MKEIDGKGHILIHTFKITSLDGLDMGALVTTDYAIGRQWERDTIAGLESEGWKCKSEWYCEWRKESNWQHQSEEEEDYDSYAWRMANY